MKIRYSPLMAALMAVSIAAFVAAPAYSASTQSDAYPSAQTQTPDQQSSTSQSSESITPATSKSDVCARLDSNHDGRISLKEFMASGKPESLFKTADSMHRGWLKADECAKALNG